MSFIQIFSYLKMSIIIFDINTFLKYELLTKNNICCDIYWNVFG